MKGTGTEGHKNCRAQEMKCMWHDNWHNMQSVRAALSIWEQA